MDAFTDAATRRASARSAVKIPGYADLAVEHADFAGGADPFTPDGVFVRPEGPSVSRTEIHRVVNGDEPAFDRGQVTTIRIDFSSDRPAGVDSYLTAQTDLVQSDHSVRGKHAFRRADAGRWRRTGTHPVAGGSGTRGWPATLLPALAPTS